MPYLGRSPGSGVRSRFIYAATSGQTSFSGNDSNSVSLAYEDTLYMDVYQNGVLLKPVTDYAATTGTSVVLTTGATTDDVVEMIVYDTFAVADTVSAKDGGTFAGNIAVTGNVTTTGTVEPAGDTSAGDNAAIGFTSAEGLILTGQGSTSDITVKNDADATVFTVPTGTDDILFPDSAEIQLGAGADLKITSDGTNGVLRANNGRIYLQSDTGINLTKNGNAETMAIATPDGSVELYHDNTVRFQTTSSGATVGNTSSSGANNGLLIINNGGTGDAMLRFDYENSADRARIGVTASGQQLEFYTAGDNERMRIGSDGSIFTQGISGSASAMSNVKIDSSNELHKDTSARITKSEIADLHIGLDEVVALTPRKFKRGSNTAFEIGFIADEMASVAPEVVMRGPKSWITNVETDTEEIDISIEYDKLTALLTKAIQELKTDLDAEKAKTTTLETQVADLISRVTALENAQ